MTAQPAAPVRPVLVTPVHYESQVSDRSFVGTVRPRIESDLGFRVAGKVSKRLVEVGTLVTPGQPLAMLDESDLSLQAEQAAAELRAATGVLAQASAAETRAKELRQKGWSTDAQLDQAKAAADEARARLNRAERSVELTKNSLSYATLVADAAGVVTATLIEPGQVVSAGQTAIRLARLAEKEVVVAIPETLLARARSGEAQVSIWSEPGKRYVARLRELAPSADAATRTYLAKFSLPEAGDEVQLGRTATLTLSDSASDRVARLPLSALFNQGEGPSLYVVDAKSGALTLKRVSVKSYESDDVLISNGVEEGANVVALGVQKLDPAQKVKIVSSLSF
jgi:RND family efflux transporter MFP subunit